MARIYDRILRTDDQVKELECRIRNIARSFIWLDGCQDATAHNIDSDYILRKTDRSWLICAHDETIVKRVDRAKPDAISALIKRYLELYDY
jgi:hypothetical protein